LKFFEVLAEDLAVRRFLESQHFGIEVDGSVHVRDRHSHGLDPRDRRLGSLGRLPGGEKRQSREERGEEKSS
jgi:hypothetical protein